MPLDHRFGGGPTDSILHPIVVVAMLVGLVLILVLPPKYVVGPLIALSFLIPTGQQLYVAGVHLFVLRILVLAAFARAIASFHEARPFTLPGGWNRLDTAFTVCTVIQAIAVVLLYQDTGSLINQIGFLWDYLPAYFAFRLLLRSKEDVYFALKCLALVAVPIAIGMVIEQKMMTNLFGMLGGIQAIPNVREGKIRSQGPFEHSLMAGTFGATLIPALYILWRRRSSRTIGAIGLAASTVIVLMTNSSTPLLAYVAGIFGLLCWPIRRWMRQIRQGIAIVLLGLEAVMKAPVWFLIARVDLTGSSSSYHRAQLVDQCIRHFSDWWLIGVKDVSNWGLDMWDAQNQFVNVAENGGLLALIAFVLLIVRAFGRLGDARKSRKADPAEAWIDWSLGAALFANLVGFFGVNYFDQSRMWWFLLLAMISTITASARRQESGHLAREKRSREPRFFHAGRLRTVGTRVESVSRS